MSFVVNNTRLYNLLIRRWFDIEQRSSRLEYSMRLLILIPLGVFCKVFFVIFRLNEYGLLNLISGFVAAFILTPLFAITLLQVFFVTHRRLHDLNASGWWQLITFIPFGQLMMIGFIFFKGTDGPNKYGDPPEY